MQQPLQITFRDLPHSETMEAEIRQRAEKLDHFFPRITACRVVIERPHRHHHQGKLYHIRVDITVPGDEIVVNRDPSKNHAHEDGFVAIRDAFEAAKRQLQDYVRRHHTEVKVHESHQQLAKVSQLFPLEDYGFLETVDGKEVYFHRHSVLNGDFDRLDIGSEVYFTEELGEKGPQASTVKRIG